MTTTTERIIIETRADGTRIVTRDLRSVADAAGKAEGASRLLGRATVALAGIYAGLKLFKVVDDVNDYRLQLSAVTQNVQQLNAVQLQLVDIARQTDGEMGKLVEAFTKIAPGVDAAGGSIEDAIQLTRDLQLAVKTSGASGELAATLLGSFSKALATGRLEGREFTQVLKQAPTLVNDLARGLGVSRGELELLAERGQISVQDIQRVFAELRPALNERLKGDVNSASDALGNFFTQFQQTLDEVNRAAGASSGVADFIDDLADGLQTITPELVKFAEALTGDEQALGTLNPILGDLISLIQGMTGAVFDLVASFRGAEDSINPILKILLAAAQGVGASFILIVGAIRNGLETFRGFATFVGEGLAALVQKVSLGAQFIKTALVDGFDAAEPIRQAFSRITVGAVLDDVVSRTAANMDVIAAETTDNINKLFGAAEARAKQAQETILRLPDEVVRATDPAGTNRGKPKDGPSADQLKAIEELTTGLQSQATELRLNAELGDAAAGALDRLKASADLAKVGITTLPGEVEAALQALDAARNFDKIAQQSRERAKELAENGLQNEELIADLQLQNALIGQSADVIAIESNLRRLNADATQEQIDAVILLSQQQVEAQAQFEEFQALSTSVFQATQGAFQQFLLNPFEEGLDGLVGGFARAMQQILAEALAKKAALALLGDGSSGNSGLLGGLIGAGISAFTGGAGSSASSVFLQSIAASNGGGAFAEGGRPPVGKPSLVGEDGPELFVPHQAGTVLNASQVAGLSQPQAPVVVPAPNVVIVRDPSEIPKALGTSEGRDAILKVIRDNRSTIKNL